MLVAEARYNGLEELDAHKITLKENGVLTNMPLILFRLFFCAITLPGSVKGMSEHFL